MIARLLLVAALVVGLTGGLTGCGRLLVGGEGSPSGLDRFAVGVTF